MDEKMLLKMFLSVLVSGQSAGALVSEDDWWLWVVLVVFICGRKYRIIITAPQSTQFLHCKKLKLKVNNSVVGTTNNSPQCTVLSDILCKQQYQTLHHAFIENKVMNCCTTYYCINTHLHKFFYAPKPKEDYNVLTLLD